MRLIQHINFAPPHANRCICSCFHTPQNIHTHVHKILKRRGNRKQKCERFGFIFLSLYGSSPVVPHWEVLTGCDTHHPHSFLSSLPLRLLWRICDLYWGIEWSMKKTENYISSSWKITQQQNSIEITQKFNFLFYARLHPLFFFLWLVFLVYICQMIFESFSPFSFHFYNPFYLMMGKERKLVIQVSWICRLDFFSFIVINFFTASVKIL